MKAQEFLTEAPKKYKVPFTKGPVTVLKFASNGITPYEYEVDDETFINDEGLSLETLVADVKSKLANMKSQGEAGADAGVVKTSSKKKSTTAKAKPVKKSAPMPHTTVTQIDFSAMAQRVVDYMKKNAAPWMAQTKNGVLQVYRGVDDSGLGYTYTFTQNIRQDRRPKDTDKKRHQEFNQAIASVGGVANRSNAAFVSGDYNQAEPYGSVYVFVPLGDFHYTWSPEYADWTQDFETDELDLLKIRADYRKDPKALAYVKQRIQGAYDDALIKAKQGNSSNKKYWNQKAQDLLNPKSETYKASAKYYLEDYTEEVGGVSAEFDPKKVSREIYVDRDLARAIKSGHEIMLHAVTGLYIDHDFYQDAVLPLLRGGKARAQESLEVALTEGVEDPDIFKAVFLIGGPGSGKTSISQKLLGHSGLRRVDVDAFFTMLKSKENIAGHYEPEFYKRAGALAGRRQDLFLKGRLGMVFDSTGRKTQRILSTKAQLENLGYDTLLIYVKTDLRTAQARNELRPRKVDPQEVEKMHSEVQQNIDVLKQAFGKNFLEVDNTFVPDLSQASAKVDAFLRLEPQHPAARKWLQGKS